MSISGICAAKSDIPDNHVVVVNDRNVKHILVIKGLSKGSSHRDNTLEAVSLKSITALLSYKQEDKLSVTDNNTHTHK